MRNGLTDVFGEQMRFSGGDLQIITHSPQKAQKPVSKLKYLILNKIQESFINLKSKYFTKHNYRKKVRLWISLNNKI